MSNGKAANYINYVFLAKSLRALSKFFSLFCIKNLFESRCRISTALTTNCLLMVIMFFASIKPRDSGSDRLPSIVDPPR